MHRLLQRLRSSDAGMSLLEVLVAMMIFAVVSLGVLQTLATVLSVTRDNRARIVATNLASQEIDLARDAGDIFTLFDDTYTKPLNGDVFTVKRSTQWVASGNTNTVCGVGGGALKYKRVNVEVTWPNMRKGTEPVRFDTLLAPDKRINDPELGTILVSVLGGAGDGISGVTVSASPSSPRDGAENLTEVVPATDVQGCTYVLKVVPGNYDVTVTRSGFITDSGQSTAPSKLAQVSAGGAASISFNFDQAATYNVKYLANPAPTGVQIPKDMSTSFVSSYGPYISTSSSSNLSRSLALFPWRSGYVGLAGGYAAKPTDPTSTAKYCASRDPAQWPQSVVGGVTYKSPQPVPVATVPGGTADIVVPMGYVDIPGQSGATIRAVSVAPVTGSDDPGCTTDVTLTFDTIKNSTTKIALPYGTWRLETPGLFGSWNPIGSILGPILGGSTSVAGTVVVDPRVAS
ncbi:prepilin-type N-terminal cleavage/methylation domain-containing protein [Salinibacterium sp. M195]|uniref:type IV pilus modification PilV family protein n=1 Tax=Salinibacterium sp. M195 TaxID=2583374 RepID=UPI001C6291A6|nr:prepilin-type N-terminal cleavage/methylation domain-containing protein [Salinibacterium sp. M195]QYH35327.1 prepilin-type N-terminal cleavage/methylation domain-containing protein [Salinibacterium sp. M195]